MSVRAWLAAETQDAHQALHRHPHLRRLLDNSLDAAAYRAILQGFQRVFVALERQRAARSCWPQLALSRHCHALARDVGPPASGHAWGLVDFEDASQVLGALYAAHGAQFGASVIAKKLRRSLPTLPHHYFTMGGNTALWSDLTAQLETQGSDTFKQDQLALGARQVFTAIGAVCAEDPEMCQVGT